MDVQAKREQEKQAVMKMIAIYCRGQHHQKEPCLSCTELTKYAFERIDRCPFMESKTFCSNCKVHCYKQDMQAQMKVVMRYSGPRMLLHNPWMAIRHVIASKKEQIRQKKDVS